MLDRRLVEDVAGRLRSDPGLVEKDWHVTRALGVIADLDHSGAIPAFGGGTSLSKAWGLIKRFSEDIDFKVAMPPSVSRNKGKRDRSAYRARIIGALIEAGFVLAAEPTKRDENRFFSADFFYPSLFDTGPGLRPHIRVEMGSVRSWAKWPVWQTAGGSVGAVGCAVRHVDQPRSANDLSGRHKATAGSAAGAVSNSTNAALAC